MTPVERTFATLSSTSEVEGGKEAEGEVGVEDATELVGEVRVNSGGVLQRINIIRDFYEDLEEGRCYWPRDAYIIHGVPDAASLIDPAFSEGAQATLREMIRELLRHVLRAEPSLHDDLPRPFRKFELQLVGVASLHLPLLYDNADVFRPAKVSIDGAQFNQRMAIASDACRMKLAILDDLRVLASKSAAAHDLDTSALVCALICNNNLV
jgi:hypothetical protein